MLKRLYLLRELQWGNVIGGGVLLINGVTSGLPWAVRVLCIVLGCLALIRFLRHDVWTPLVPLAKVDSEFRNERFIIAALVDEHTADENLSNTIRGGLYRAV